MNKGLHNLNIYIKLKKTLDRYNCFYEILILNIEHNRKYGKPSRGTSKS